MSAALTAQPGLYSTATAVSTKVKGTNRKRKKSAMAGGACATISIPPEAVREVSVIMKNSLVISGILITGVDRNISLSLMKASSCSFPQLKGTPFLVKLMSGQVIAEK